MAPSHDGRVLDPNHLPTPFTAAEIRAAAQDGYTVETLTETATPAGADTVRSRTTFLACDDDGATMRRVEIDDGGAEIGGAAEARSSWLELQAHASFPAGIAQRTREPLDHVLGRLDCLRYDVVRDEDRMVFWFSIGHPGMPVRFETRKDGRPISTTTVVSVTRPG